MSNITKKLILQGQVYSSHYENGLSNHLPMALYALDSIGAETETIQSFNDTYIGKLEKPRLDKADINDGNWKDSFGDDKYYSSLVDYFQKKLVNNGLNETLNNFLPILFKGISGAAFHPLIRLAYGIEMNESSEVSHGLASWVVSYQELNPFKNIEKRNITLEDLLKELKVSFQDYGYKREGYGIFSRLKKISELKPFTHYNDSISSLDFDLSDISDLAIKTYLSTDDNFTALHIVTSTHAVRVVSEVVTIDKGMMRYFIQALGAAYIDSGMPDLIESNFYDNLPDWSEIKKETCLSDNDHAYKLVYTCEKEFQNNGNILYKVAASRKSGLI